MTGNRERGEALSGNEEALGEEVSFISDQQCESEVSNVLKKLQVEMKGEEEEEEKVEQLCYHSEKLAIA